MIKLRASPASVGAEPGTLNSEPWNLEPRTLTPFSSSHALQKGYSQKVNSFYGR